MDTLCIGNSKLSVLKKSWSNFGKCQACGLAYGTAARGSCAHLPAYLLCCQTQL